MSITQKIALFKKFGDHVQGDKTVMEYIKEFEALSKYGLSLIGTPEKKNDEFVMELDDSFGAYLLNPIKG